VFSNDEAHALMAYVFRMAAAAFERDQGQFEEPYADPVKGTWQFGVMLQEVVSTAASMPPGAIKSPINAL
jgi:hypothetical protein